MCELGHNIVGTGTLQQCRYLTFKVLSLSLSLSHIQQFHTEWGEGYPDILSTPPHPSLHSKSQCNQAMANLSFWLLKSNKNIVQDFLFLCASIYIPLNMTMCLLLFPSINRSHGQFSTHQFTFLQPLCLLVPH